MSLEKAIQKLTNAITAAKMPGVLPEPSIIPGNRRLGDCPVTRVGTLDTRKLTPGQCCYATFRGQCQVQCMGPSGPSNVRYFDGPCPQDGLFIGDDTYQPSL